MRILILEDDPRISSFLCKGLKEEGHVVDVATEIAAAKKQISEHPPELLLVDRMLPDGDGLSLVRELRRCGSRTPAICLTARDRVADRVEGLNGGADDYLIKPFSFEELLARMAAVMRRGGSPEGVLQVGDLVIDPERHRATRQGKDLQLTSQEFALLRYLAEHQGKVLSRTRLLENVWDMHHDPGTNVVDVYVSYLRAKVDKGFETTLIHTVRGVGYMLEAP
jgi:DNA-binding response OmpR family regulator